MTDEREVTQSPPAAEAPKEMNTPNRDAVISMYLGAEAIRFMSVGITGKVLGEAIERTYQQINRLPSVTILAMSDMAQSLINLTSTPESAPNLLVSATPPWAMEVDEGVLPAPKTWRERLDMTECEPQARPAPEFYTFFTERTGSYNRLTGEEVDQLVDNKELREGLIDVLYEDCCKRLNGRKENYKPKTYQDEMERIGEQLSVLAAVGDGFSLKEVGRVAGRNTAYVKYILGGSYRGLTARLSSYGTVRKAFEEVNIQLTDDSVSGSSAALEPAESITGDALLPKESETEVKDDPIQGIEQLEHPFLQVCERLEPLFLNQVVKGEQNGLHDLIEIHRGVINTSEQTDKAMIWLRHAVVNTKILKTIPIEENPTVREVLKLLVYGLPDSQGLKMPVTLSQIIGDAGMSNDMTENLANVFNALADRVEEAAQKRQEEFQTTIEDTKIALNNGFPTWQEGATEKIIERVLGHDLEPDGGFLRALYDLAKIAREPTMRWNYVPKQLIRNFTAIESGAVMSIGEMLAKLNEDSAAKELNGGADFTNESVALELMRAIQQVIGYAQKSRS